MALYGIFNSFSIRSAIERVIFFVKIVVAKSAIKCQNWRSGSSIKSEFSCVLENLADNDGNGEQINFGNDPWYGAPLAPI